MMTTDFLELITDEDCSQACPGCGLEQMPSYERWETITVNELLRLKALSFQFFCGRCGKPWSQDVYRRTFSEATKRELGVWP